MANIAYELAIRFGTVVWLHSQARKHADGSAERMMATERNTPLADLKLPEGRPVYWLHAVSMGEVGVAKVLVEELKAQAPDALVVVSTSTATGFEAAKKITGADAVVAARFDIRDLVSTMFAAIRPSAVILVEGDLWRNMLAVARRRGVPVFVANAKLSAKSLGFYHKFPVYARSLFSRLARVYAQTELYRERFLDAGLPADHCVVTGNVKLDITPPSPTVDEMAEIAKTAGCEKASPVVVFGSLHPGEEVVALRGMERVWQTHPSAHAIIVPRHIEKTPLFVESIRRESGFEPIVYSQREAPGPMPIALDGQDVRVAQRTTIVDKMGMLMKLYALADIGVVGGTFVPGIGGHNLTEPSSYGKPVLYGPYVHSQLGLHELMKTYDASRQSTQEAFPNSLASLVDDIGLSRRLGENGRHMVEASRGVAERIVSDVLERTTSTNG